MDKTEGRDAGRTEVVAASPEGEKYRIVTARKGVPLRTGPFLLSILLEVFGEAFVGARSPACKIGVFASNTWGYERRYLKLEVQSPAEAQQLAGTIAEEITRGELRWQRHD